MVIEYNQIFDIIDDNAIKLKPKILELRENGKMIAILERAKGDIVFNRDDTFAGIKWNNLRNLNFVGTFIRPDYVIIEGTEKQKT